MRKLWRTLIVVLLLCSVLGWVQSAKISLPGWERHGMDSQKLALVREAKISRAFVLPAKEWLQFPLAAGAGELRVVSTASVREIAQARQSHLQDPGKRWTYALLLEFLDAQGQVLASQTWHQSANLLEKKRPDGTLVGAAFYLETGLYPLSGEVTTVNLQAMPQARSVRARLHSADPQVADVVLRLFQPRPFSAQDLAHHWGRLSPQQQEEIARGSVHDKALLQEQEKQNLLRNARQALGPLGQEGQDYTVRDLYVLFENEGELQAAPVASYGVPLDRQSYATLPIPPQGGQLRLEFVAAPTPPAPAAGNALTAEGGVANSAQNMATNTAASTTANPATNPATNPAASADLVRGETAGGPIHVRWFGPGLFQRSASTLAWPGGKAQSVSHVLPVKGGLLELDAPQPLIMRAYFTSNGKEQEITPLPQTERVFIAGTSQPVTYALSASPQQSGLRLSVRSLLPAASLASATRARYAAYDAQGTELAQGTLVVPGKPTNYERLLPEYDAISQGKVLLDAAMGFFVLPAKAASFKVWADSDAAPLLVVAHTRPMALAREVRVPDDFYSFDALGQRIPGWFMLKPQDEEAMLANNRSRLLSLQTRPMLQSEEQTQIINGQYQWQDYRPRGNWLARPIFTPRESDLPYREDVLPTTFTPLALQQNQSITLPAYFGASVITPSLVWLGPDQAAELELQLDGKPFYTLQVHGPYAEYALPAMAAGKHRLQITARLAGGKGGSSRPANQRNNQLNNQLSNQPGDQSANQSGNQPSRSPGGQVYLNHLLPTPASLVKRIGQRFNGELVFDYERTSQIAETLTARLYQAPGQHADARLRVKIEGPPLPVLKPLSAWVFAERVASVRAAPGVGKVFDSAGQISDAGSPVFLPFPPDAPLGRYRISLRADAGSAAWVSFSRLSPALQPQWRAQQQQEIQSVQIIE